MGNVSVREPCNNGGRVPQRIPNGETLTATMHGHPIAELGPVAGRGVTAAALLQRWHRLPPVNASAARAFGHVAASLRQPRCKTIGRVNDDD